MNSLFTKIGIFFSDWFMLYFREIVEFLIIFFIGIVIGKLVGKIVKRILSEIELNTLVKKATKKKLPVVNIISSFVRYIIYFITFIILLNRLGITTTFFEIVGGGIVILLCVGALISLKDFFPNFFAGLTLKHTLQRDDVIEYRKAKGKIIKLNLTDLVIENAHHDLIYIPYSELKRELFRIIK